MLAFLRFAAVVWAALFGCVAAPDVDGRQAKVDRLLARLADTIRAGKFKPTYRSLAGYPVPEWYVDGKLGIFIHYGIFSVPGFSGVGCWYGHNMYDPSTSAYAFHRATYGPQDRFGYKDFIPHLTASAFAPDAWAKLFKEAGAAFVCPVCEFHDGFPMYDCSLTMWNAARMGPKRDYIGQLAAAVRRQGMKFAFSNHRAEHLWYFEPALAHPSDVGSLQGWDMYGHGPSRKAFEDDYLARLVEAVDRYRPDLVWFDAYSGALDRSVILNFDAFYYNRSRQWGKGVVINDKNGDMPASVVLDFERGKEGRLSDRVWQTDTSVSWRDWSYMQNDSFKTSDFVIRDFVDIVSKNGVLLLDVGPRADGTIPPEPRGILQSVGRWLKVNGEAIYGTRPSRELGFGEGPHNSGHGSFSDTDVDYNSHDFRFTRKAGALYAIALEWPTVENHFLIRSLSSNRAISSGGISNVEMLGCHERLQWRPTTQGLWIQCPRKRPCEAAYAFKISLKGFGVDALSASRLNDADVRVTATVRNFDNNAIRRRLAFFVNGRAVRTQEVRLGPRAFKGVSTVLKVAPLRAVQRICVGPADGELFPVSCDLVCPSFESTWRFDGRHTLNVAGLGKRDRATVALWVKPDKLDEGWTALLNTVGWPEGALHYQFEGSALQIAVNGALDAVVEAPGAGNWQHLAVVYDGPARTASAFVNGKLVASLALEKDVPLDLETVRLGGWDDHQRYLTGSMAEVRVYGAALSAADVQALFEGRATSQRALADWSFGAASRGVVPDVSGHGLNAIVVN